MRKRLKLKARTKRLNSNRFRRILQIRKRKHSIAQRQRVGFMLRNDY